MLTGQLLKRRQLQAGLAGAAGGGVSMAEAQEAVAAAAERGALLWTLPWVGCLFWLWPPAGARLRGCAGPAGRCWTSCARSGAWPVHGTCFDCII